jgi:predicted TIM-barrel fold metal-dependent hydrolase
VLDGQQVGTLGAVMQAGQRFEDPSQIDFLGIWDDVRKGAYDPHAMIVENEQDGIWGSALQPSQGLFWYRVPDSRLLSEICRVYNDWIADFCKPYPERLKGIAMLNLDDPDEGAAELERVAKMGLVGSFIPVAPRPDKPYNDPAYDRLWAVAEELKHPLLLHIGTPRDGIPANEFTMDVTELTGAGRSTTDYWVRYSLGSMVFAGVFDKFPGLRIGSVEHEAAWIPHWLKQMDFTYVERPVFTKGWKSAEGLMPSDYWKRNMFVEFMEDDLGVQLRDRIGVENMLWGSDYPHAEATFPRSQQFLGRMFAGVPEADLRKITSDNAAKMFGFTLN